jgi:hypothetical protein
MDKNHADGRLVNDMAFYRLPLHVLDRQIHRSIDVKNRREKITSFEYRFCRVLVRQNLHSIAQLRKSPPILSISRQKYPLHEGMACTR